MWAWPLCCSAACVPSVSQQKASWVVAARGLAVKGLPRASLPLSSLPSSPRWFVLLDTAAFAPHHALNLSDVAPDFAAVSFYKMFG